MTRLEELIVSSQAGNMEAKEQLLADNAGLIWSVTRRFFGRGVEPDDLYQLGCLGFLKAIEGFDVEFGTQFSTYAVPKIAGEIRRFLRDDGTVKISRTIKEQAAVIKTTRGILLSTLGREPTIQEISRQCGITPEEIALAENAMSVVESIQQPSGENGFTLENILSDTESEDVLLEKLALRQAIRELPEREEKSDHFTIFSLFNPGTSCENTVSQPGAGIQNREKSNCKITGTGHVVRILSLPFDENGVK